MGRILMMAGGLIFLAGVLITFYSRLPFHLGRLPGDIVIRGKNSTFYFPLATCIVISLVLSILSWLLRRR